MPNTSENVNQKVVQTAKFTPGPWWVEHFPDGVLTIKARDHDGLLVCPATVHGDATDDEYGPVTRANAALIAAAPDLLAACERLSYQLATNDGDRRSLLAQVDKAIAKAKGGAA